jgi:hypothetical protein
VWKRIQGPFYLPMKSIIWVKFVGVRYRSGKKITFTQKIVAEDINFENQKPSILHLPDGISFESAGQSAYQLAEEWLSSQSKILQDIINDPRKELRNLEDWKVVQVRNFNMGTSSIVRLKNVPIKETLSVFEKDMVLFSAMAHEHKDMFTEDFTANLLHTYVEMQDALKGISQEKRILIVLRAMVVASMAGSKAYSDIINLLGQKDEESIEKYKLFKSQSQQLLES